MTDLEQWKDVPGFGGHYQASSLGRVWSRPRTVTKRTRYGGVMTQEYPGRMLKPYLSKGYARLRLGFGGQKMNVHAHTLVLCAFYRPPEPGDVCRHLDGARDNNHPENLTWGTHKENMEDRKLHGRYARGSDHHGAKIGIDEVRLIRASTLSAKEMAKTLNITESHIYTIRSGDCWGWIS